MANKSSSSKYETALFSKEQLESAKSKGQFIGWIQGAVSVGALLILLNFLGWIPLIIIASLLGFVGYKVVTKSKTG